MVLKNKKSLQSLFVAILLIVLGTIYPSNGLDDVIFKAPLKLFVTMIIVVFIGLTVYFIWNWIDKIKNDTVK